MTHFIMAEKEELAFWGGCETLTDCVSTGHSAHGNCSESVKFFPHKEPLGFRREKITCFDERELKSKRPFAALVRGLPGSFQL